MSVRRFDRCEIYRNYNEIPQQKKLPLTLFSINGAKRGEGLFNANLKKMSVEARLAKLEAEIKELADLQLRSAKAGLMKAIAVKILGEKVTELENKLSDAPNTKKRKVTSKDHTDSDNDDNGFEIGSCGCGICNAVHQHRMRVSIPASAVKSKDEEETTSLRVSDVVDAVQQAVKDFNAANPTKKVKVEAIRVEKIVEKENDAASRPLP